MIECRFFPLNVNGFLYLKLKNGRITTYLLLSRPFADTSVPMYNCDSYDTGSLSGRHPSVADGAVTEKWVSLTLAGAVHIH